jgi:predicted 2-oxoglutarate/Fe(II)-dependent dioxygenase YbiX
MQLPETAPEARELGNIVIEAVGRSNLFMSAVLPKHVFPPLFNRITRGVRIALFFWTQSMVRDEGRRTLLFDLDVAIIKLGRDHAGHPSVVELTAVYHNLLRQWAEL